MRRFYFVLITTVIMIATVFAPIGVEAETVSGDYKYEVVNGSAKIVKYLGADMVVDVPTDIDGYVVTSIGDAFYNCSSITEITIPPSVTDIGDCAFGYCRKLERITLPESVKSIGDYAFYKCYELKEIVIPDGVTSIEKYTFHKCYCLSEIILPSSVERIGEWAFESCSSLESIYIMNSKCDIYSSSFTIPEITVIYGYEDSTAQEYAEVFNIAFVSLGIEPTEPETQEPTIEVTENSLTTDVPETTSIVHTTTDVTESQNATETTIGNKEKFLLGDANLDEKINIKDATIIQKYAASLETLSDIQLITADANGDEKVNVKDATAIQKYVAGMVEEGFIGEYVDIN